MSGAENDADRQMGTPMRRFASIAALSVLLAGMVGVPPAGAAGAYSVQTLHFKVTVGPNDDRTCDVVGDLYTPDAASSSNRVPAVLTTNGFGGSKDDQAGMAKMLAARGYVALSYSGLGFGGSGCKITLDDPDWDGKAGSQLVSFLGGRSGIAFHDAQHADPAPALTVVKRDATDHNGQSRSDDPRVGTIGGSYGGGFQFATASVDPRVDTLIPFITWNDLSYSLAPNGTDQTSGVSTATPGATKLWWGLTFSLLGMTSDATNGQVPPDALPCPNFADFVCPALVTAGTLGYFQQSDVDKLRHASVATYMSKIKVPVLLAQGQDDTLFNLNEAAATYSALAKQGTEVKMMWQSWGHSSASGADGEIDWADPDPSTQYEVGRVVDWFSHYLKDSTAGTGPRFAYYRDYVPFSGSAEPAYGTSSSFPVGTARTWKLTGKSSLFSDRAAVAGSQSFTTTAAGAPTDINEADVLGSFTGPGPSEVDAPGTFGAWQTAAMTSSLDVVGTPKLHLKVSAQTAAATQGIGPAGKLVLFVKLADVGPDGKASSIHDLETPVRVPDVTKPFDVKLPAIVHRFAAGHRLKLIVAGGAMNYRGGTTPNPVTISSGDDQTLTLPIVGG